MIQEQKAKIRKELVALRATIDVERKAADEHSVAAGLFAIIADSSVDSRAVVASCATERSVKGDQNGKNCCRRSGFIGLYDAFGSELSVGILAEKLREEGYQLAFPVAFEDGSMDFFSEEVVSDAHRNAGQVLLTTSQADGRSRFDFHANLPAYKKHQRAQTDCLKLVEPEQVGFVVVPGVGFDKQNYRLGYGAGYYDRYLPRLLPQTPLWGAAFSEQLIEELPTQEHDVALTGVVTPEVVRAGAITL